MNTYYLSKGPGQAGEGPFTAAQIRAMRERNIIGDEAKVCAVGALEWREMREELGDLPSAQPPDQSPGEAPPAKMRSWDKPIDRPEEEDPLVGTLGTAASWMFVAFLVLSCIPGANAFFIGYILAGVAGGSVFGIVMMTKGAVGKGVRLLVCSWIGLPLLVIVGKSVVTAMTGGKM
jgi:hypothetical protein